MNKYRQACGVTLVELLVTITVAAILLGIAVPSFVNLLAANREVAQTSLFVNALNYARSEAVKRGQIVYVSSLNGGDWTKGWQIFAKSPGNLGTTFEVNDTVLRNQATFTGNAQLSGSAGTTYVGFSGSGALLTNGSVSGSDNTGSNTELQFSFTVPGRTDLSKTISINIIGRVAIQ